MIGLMTLGIARGAVLVLAVIPVGVAAVVAATPAAAQTAPLLRAVPLDQVPLVVMPAVDVAALREEDARQTLSARAAPTRFAQPIPTNLTPTTDGIWETLAGGWRLWSLRIRSPAALSLNLWLDRFELPPGASLWLRDLDGEVVHGPYIDAHRNAAGGLWTPVVPGEHMVVELIVPPRARTPDLRISSVNHGYRLFGEPLPEASTKQGTCNIDVVCPEGDPWRDQIRSVARITILGSYACTSQLLNNTSGDDTPYLLTAHHCVESPTAAPSIVSYWNYESPTCGALSGGDLTQNTTGADWVASWSLTDGSDFTLVVLDHDPEASYDVYFAGWDARDMVPSGGVGIHHPSADEKALCFDDDPPTVTSYGGDVSPGDGNYLRIGEWELGTTEGGSSGSCVFDPSTGLCVGTLTGGLAACGVPLPDWYGRFHRHFSGGGTPETRLRDWLDPLGTGALWLAGKDPGQPPTPTPTPTVPPTPTPTPAPKVIFGDGFESGDTTAWSRTVPDPPTQPWESGITHGGTSMRRSSPAPTPTPTEFHRTPGRRSALHDSIRNSTLELRGSPG
jgi:lysyl endopeptidase